MALSVVLNRHVLLLKMLITETGWALRDWERKQKETGLRFDLEAPGV